MSEPPKVQSPKVEPPKGRPHQAALDELGSRTVAALRMGGEEKVAQRRAKGVLDARQRLDTLLDPGSFVESGMHARGIRKEVAERTPADGKIAGYGRIDGREVGVVSNDFTVLGASSSAINGKKIRHVRETATKRSMPLVLLGESADSQEIGPTHDERRNAPPSPVVT